MDILKNNHTEKYKSKMEKVTIFIYRGSYNVFVTRTDGHENWIGTSLRMSRAMAPFPLRSN